MPKITLLEVQSRNAERVNVYLDGAFGFAVSALVAASRHLSTGVDLSDAELEEIRRDESADNAYNAALNYLSFRPRSEREIADYFRRKKVDPDLAEAALARLKRIDLVNDENFARFWVENRQNFRARGTRALRSELRTKGLSTQLIDGALESVGDELEIAVEVGRKKMKSYGGLAGPAFRTKMLGFLQRRGFTYDVASKSCRILIEEADLLVEDDEVEPAPDDGTLGAAGI